MTTSLDTHQDIMEVIPQRPPFLFLDAIVDNKPSDTTTAEYLVDAENPNFIGHFPGKPILPGVLIVEHMAQTACYCLGSDIQDPNCEYLLVKVNNCAFKDKVVPGDSLTTRVILERKFDSLAIFKCETKKLGKVIAQAELVVAFKLPQAATMIGN